MEIVLVSPSTIYYEDLKSYVDEFSSREDAEGTNGLYIAMKANTFDYWLEWINKYDAKTFLIVNQENKVVGITNIRYKMNKYSMRVGGNIGYNIRPSERRKGYASKALKLILNDAYNNGLENVRIDCYKENIGSIKTIESCGAELLSEEYIEERNRIVLKYNVDLQKVLNKNKAL